MILSARALPVSHPRGHALIAAIALLAPAPMAAQDEETGTTITVEAEVPINGQEVLALHLTPGPVSLEGIEVVVIRREDLEARALGTSSHALIGPAEMEDLRQRYFNLGEILRTRSLPRARYHPPKIPGETGCLKPNPRPRYSAEELRNWGAPPSAQPGR